MLDKSCQQIEELSLSLDNALKTQEELKKANEATVKQLEERNREVEFLQQQKLELLEECECLKKTSTSSEALQKEIASLTEQNALLKQQAVNQSSSSSSQTSLKFRFSTQEFVYSFFSSNV